MIEITKYIITIGLLISVAYGSQTALENFIIADINNEVIISEKLYNNKIIKD